MKLKRRITTIFILLALLALPTGNVFAQGPGPGSGRVVFGQSITVASGENFEGDLIVFGGNVTIEEGAEFDGNVVVIGGNVVTSGEQDGDMVIVGGQIRMEDDALITGDVVLVGGQIDRDDTATIEGELINNVAPQIDIPNGSLPPNIPNVPDVPNPPAVPSIPGVVNLDFNPFFEVGQAFIFSLLMAFFAMLVTLFFQKRLDYVSQAVVSQPVMVGGIGLLSVVVAAALFLTVIPVVVLGFAWLFGVVAIGLEVGDRFGKAMRQDWTPVINAGVGAFVLVFVLAALDAVNRFSWLAGCVTWVVPALIGLLAVGGVVITRFGAKPVQGPGSTVYPPPVEADASKT